MSKRNYEQEIIEYCIDRMLHVDVQLMECDQCKEYSRFVELHDITYRNYSESGLKPNLVPLCYHCYIYTVVVPMDDLWADYYSGLL